MAHQLLLLQEFSETVQSGDTLLCKAAREDRFDVVEAYLDTGNDIDQDEQSPIIHACMGRGRDSSMVEFLLSRGLRIEWANDGDDNSAIYVALSYSNFTLAERLVSLGFTPLGDLYSLASDDNLEGLAFMKKHFNTKLDRYILQVSYGSEDMIV